MDWFRLALDGRISQRRGGGITYEEAGFGLGLLDAPHDALLPGGGSRLEQRDSGVPSFQLVSGLRGDPDRGPAMQIELGVVLGLGVERPTALELTAGIAF